MNMPTEIMAKDDLVLGTSINVFAVCSNVEVLQNLSTGNSFREEYNLLGYSGLNIKGLIFKLHGNEEVNREMFTDAPVMLRGRVGEYRGALQIMIDSITSLKSEIMLEDMLCRLVDTRYLDALNDFVNRHNDVYFPFRESHLNRPKGLVSSGAGDLAIRMLKVVTIMEVVYPELVVDYCNTLSVLIPVYMDTELNLSDRLDAIKTNDSPLLRALLFGTRDYPDYEEFVLMHHLIMKPRGLSFEIVDNYFNNFSTTDSNS